MDIIYEDYLEGFQIHNDDGDNDPGYFEIKDCSTEALNRNVTVCLVDREILVGGGIKRRVNGIV